MSDSPVDSQDEPREAAEPQKPLNGFWLFLLWVAAQLAFFLPILGVIVLAALYDLHIAIIIVLLLIVVIFAAGFAMKIWTYRRRRSGIDDVLAALDTWAHERGLKRENNHKITLDMEAAPFDLPGIHVAARSWTGRYRDQGAAILHYLVDTGTRKHPERRVFTVVAVTGNGDFPMTEAVPQRARERVSSALGRDLDTESEEFNRAWRVVSADKQVTHSLFTPVVIERMVAQADKPVRTLWSKGAIATVSTGATLDTDVLGDRLDFVTDLATLVPGFARTDAGFTGAPASQLARPDTVGKTKRERSGTEMLLLGIGIVALLSVSWLFRNVGPAAGWPAVVIGLVIAGGSSRISAWIDRKRSHRSPSK